MDNNQEPSPQEDRPQQENETQRLHRLVIPMILDILRSRGGRRHSARSNNQDSSADSLWNSLNSMQDDPPHLETATDAESSSLNNPASDDMVIDEADDVNRSTSQESPSSDSASLLEDHEPAPMTDQQGQLIPSPTETPSPASRRPRYRLVVYFEERELMGEENNDADGESTPREEPHRPSRYVAIFSIDSDAQNMPIIHSAGLQQSPANFDDILNQLFASYMPKGTPPAKKEIIDTLPTATFSHETCAAQPKCAVCLEQFEEGSEVVVLPCSHRFHGEECVKPWLRMHSSCPICRYEMPVDDMEYEEKRKERMAKRVIPASDDLTQQEVVVDEPPLL